MVVFAINKETLNSKAFPDKNYRFSRVTKKADSVILERDYLGENPLHYYRDVNSGQLFVASSIKGIKKELERQGIPFAWDRVRAVHNNTKVIFTGSSFSSLTTREEEVLPTLQKTAPPRH